MAPRAPARAIAAVASLVVAGGCGPPGSPGDPGPARDAERPHVLLISVDTLRADHLGCYGYRLDTSPSIDALAGRGVRFEDTTVPWPKTWPAMASMMTGLYPRTSGVQRSPRRPLPEEHATLPEVLRDAGYGTGAVVANANVGREFGFAQGFDAFVESWIEEHARLTGDREFKNHPGGVKSYTNATLVTDQGLAVLDRLLERGGPFFLWLHYIDPHGPFLPPDEYLGYFEGAHESEPIDPKFIPRYQLQHDPETGEPVTDMAHYRAQYDREIRYLDDELGRLFDELDGRGLAEGTLVVLTADHGESLGEQSYYLEHGALPYQSTAHVPLILAWPGRLPAGATVSAAVGLLDVAPTVLELVGLESPAGTQGTSLVPALEGRAEGPRFVFMESGRQEETQLTVRSGEFKLVELRTLPEQRALGRDAVELYDVRADPGEATNVIARHPDVAERLRAALAAWQEETPVYAGEAPAQETEELDPRTQDVLRDLGYVE